MRNITYEIKASKDTGATLADLDFIDTHQRTHSFHILTTHVAERYWEDVFYDWDYPTKGLVFVRATDATEWERFEISVECSPLVTATKS